MPGLRLDNLRKTFGRVVALDGLSLEVGVGEAVALFGPSGCGKTTALRLIAGLEKPDAGSVFLDGREAGTTGLVSSRPDELVPPGARGRYDRSRVWNDRSRIGMVFQDLALWPHMRVRAQIEFVLKALKCARDERRARSDDLLARFELQDCASNWPHELSGGEKQRLAIARAVAANPSLLLLDEPFANLDESRVERVMEYLKERKREGVTIVFASHQREDVSALADKVVMMRAEGYVSVSADEFREAYGSA